MALLHSTDFNLVPVVDFSATDGPHSLLDVVPKRTDLIRHAAPTTTSIVTMILVMKRALDSNANL